MKLSFLTPLIERFYARNLPLSPELAKNLQSFEPAPVW
jgi:hypothetical protein